jgi:hypothetical protein
VLVVQASPAGAQFRTPAETELRRAEIAQRLHVLAEEQTLLERRLRELREALAAALSPERHSLEALCAAANGRLTQIGGERDALASEADVLAGIATRTPTGPIARADPRGLIPAQMGGTAQTASGNAFNPAITVIPDGRYFYDDEAGEAGRRLTTTAGFTTPDGEHDGRDTRGFSLREVELALSGAVDPYFDVWATFGIGDGAIEAEEVYVQTRRFLPGVQVRFGQFLSGIGHLNRQHAHQWDFADQALPYTALFGGRVGDVGVQVTWLPDMPVYTQLGFEALQGDNPAISHQLHDEYPELLEETPGPRLFTGFVKVAPDLGFSKTLQGGFSIGRSRSHQELEETDVLPQVSDGTSWFIGTDWIWRYDSPRPYGEGDLAIQGEYILRAKSLSRVGAAGRSQSTSQDGLYAQIVYGAGPRWTIGGRVEAIGLRNRLKTEMGSAELGASSRYSANSTFNPTEFSRLRIQYSYGVAAGGGSSRTHQFQVQVQMSLGVHGAHAF